MNSFGQDSWPARSAIAVLAAILFALVGLTPAAAQQPPSDSLVVPSSEEVVGQVVRGGEPVSNAPVTLHRVTPQEAGEIANAVTDAQGRFRFRLESIDESDFNVFFVTAEYLSARYFGPPLHPDAPAENYTIEVFDTTSTPNVPIQVRSRDIVLIPEASGSWEVNEVVRVANDGEAALVAPEGMPTWRLAIPERAAQFQVGEGDILAHEVTLMDNEVLMLTPVTPGERDLFIRYRLPATPARATFTLEQPTQSFNLFVLQPSHLSSVEGLASTRMVEAEGEQFLQYSGDSLNPGTEINLEWSNAGAAPVDPILAAVGATLVLLAFGLWGALRNRPVAA